MLKKRNSKELKDLENRIKVTNTKAHTNTYITKATP